MFSGYSPKAKQYIYQSIRHAYRIECAGRDLEVQDASVSFDEFNSPHVRLTAQCVVPEDQAYLDALDPRTFPRVYVYLGYVYPGGETDLPLVANLSLTSRSVNRPTNTMSLVAESDEAIVGERGHSGATWNFGTNFSPTATITALLSAGSPATALSVETSRPNIVTDADKPYTVRTGGDYMRAVVDLADQAGDLWVYDDGLRTFHVRDRAQLGAAAHNLTVGANGTIFSSSTTMSREDWGNALLVVHTFRDANNIEQTVTGYAAVTDGPYAVNTVGRTLMVLERGTPASAGQAVAAAQTVLGRVMSRGRSFALDAHSAYWLRPGDTVTAQLPTGEQERHLVQSVTFSVPEGRMSVVTRLPQDIRIN